jgi:formylglycine-generating enzyme required for sulfatase activity
MKAMASVCATLVLVSASAIPAEKAYPAWDGKETIDAYAQRVGLKPVEVLDLGEGIRLELVLVPAGSFLMGSPDGEAQGEDKGKEKQHKITLTQPFYLGKYELTQAQYQKVMGANPSKVKGNDLPVTEASWDDATAFCRKLGGLVKRDVQLPTEAQWEYACRAGTTTAYHSGNGEADLGKVAWYGNNSGRKLHPVGQKTPNAWGLHDMHGNVREFTRDWLADYTGADATDPTGPDKGTTHVVRGGAFTTVPGSCRAATRRPVENLSMTGFRVMMAAPKAP